MTILIIEDEQPAAERLERLIREIEPEAHILGTIVSIKSALKWFEDKPLPDLIFQDIQLSDGNAFEIYKKVKVSSAIVFTTAYDEFALQAFRVNSIDYLLKPIKKEELIRAFEKFRNLKPNPENEKQKLESLLETLTSKKIQYKSRFLIRFGDQIKSIDVNDIAYFFTEDKINYLRTFDGYNYPVDNNLDELEHLLDPSVFFRINRQFIIGIKSIESMYAFSKSRVKINLQPHYNGDTIVSTERSPHFKNWLAGEEQV
ncbi:MAG: DNA-binding response regulator [Bacteroidetes bacterium]|nr:MAG: DNA-binding response regulator [Bacteroidota bacterium]